MTLLKSFIQPCIKLLGIVLACVLLITGSAFAQVIDLVNDPEAVWPFDEDERLLHVWLPVQQTCEAALIVCDGHSAAIDCSEAGQASGLAALAQAYTGSMIDTLFISHPHHDHIGGLGILSAFVHIDRMLCGFPADATEHMERAVDIARMRGIEFGGLEHGQVFHLGDATLTVSFFGAASWSMNDRSAVMRLEFGDSSMLFTADIGEKVIDRMVICADPAMLDVDILKAPHHGKTILSAEFLNLATPEMTIVTNNKSVHNLIQCMERRNIPLLFTYQKITHLATDGKTWAVEQMTTGDIPVAPAYNFGSFLVTDED